jgi:hypothetical protein
MRQDRPTNDKTMKKIILLFLIFTGRQAFCQTNFSIGFSDGYKIGYCYDQGIDCIAPISPIAPLCKMGESLDSYFDGYNRGLLVGTSDKTSKSNSQKSNNSTAVYGQPTYIPQIVRFKPDYAFYERALKQNQSNYEKNIANSKTQIEKERWEETDKIVREYMSPENVARREEFVNLLKQYYLDLKTYPTSIPNGVYKVTITSEPQAGQEKLKTNFDEGEALVEGNKVILLKTSNKFSGGDSYMLSVDKFPDVKNKEDGGIGITESYYISNGKGEIRYKLFFSGNPFTKSELQKVYFIDYIVQFQNAQKCIEEIKKKYNTLKKYPKIQDGWNIVYANDGEGFCEVRKVLVENGKVTHYKRSDGTDAPITSGGNILDNKTTISFVRTLPDGSNTESFIVELYFM